MATKTKRYPGILDSVRYVPVIAGSPGWMSFWSASLEYWREMETIQSLAKCGSRPAGDPRIEFNGNDVYPLDREKVSVGGIKR